jgi:general secretion pathway protein J
MTGRSAAGPRSELGFTLVEMLVVLALLGLFTVLLFGGLRLGSRSWDTAQRLSADARETAGTLDAIARDLRAAYPLMLPPRRDEPASVAFDGRAQSLEFLSAAPTASGAMTRIAVFARQEGQSLSLWEREDDELGASGTGRSRRLITGIDGISIAYFGRRRGEPDARWADSWTAQGRLPNLVRITLSFRDARRSWPALVIAPRIDGAAACVLDALTGFCQGAT